MNIVTAFITYSQSTKLVQPRKSSFDYPAENPQVTAVFCSAFRQKGIYTQLTQCLSMGLAIISSITLNTIRSFARTTHFTCDRRNRPYQWQKLRDTMTVCSGYFHRERDTVAIGDNMMFRPQFPSIRCIRARFRPPKTARTEAEFTIAREKSILSFFLRCLRTIRCILSQTPAFCQSFSRRQQVMPDPQPISLGKYCQGIPVFNTKIIPVRALRSSTGGLPPLCRGACFGMTGSMSFHNWSFTSGLAMCWSSMRIYRILGFPTHVLSDKPLFKF